MIASMPHSFCDFCLPFYLFFFTNNLLSWESSGKAMAFASYHDCDGGDDDDDDDDDDDGSLLRFDGSYLS